MIRYYLRGAYWMLAAYTLAAGSALLVAELCRPPLV